MIGGASSLHLVSSGGMPGAAVSPALLSPLPPAIYQFIPHTPFSEMEASLPFLANMGFSAVQMPPVHPPGITRFGDKLGSAYAPRDHSSVSPHLFAGVSPADYLNSSYTPPEQSDGWAAFRKFTARARELGLQVVGDLVFAHTARDRDVVDRHSKDFGEGFYKADEPAQMGGANQEDGSFDEWNDVKPIDHAGPARAAILRYFTDVTNRFIEAGVTVFRVDAAPRIQNDFWAQLIDGARVFARDRGYETPAFYAEALGVKGRNPLDVEVELVRDGKFDGVTTSMRWWKDLRESWLLERFEAVRRAGGTGVSFIDSHDTTRAVNEFRDFNAILVQLALTAFMSSSIIVLQGTKVLEGKRPSVFLDRYEPLPPPHRCQTSDMRRFLEMVLGIRNAYEIFRMPAYTERTDDGGPIIRIQRTTPDEQVLIAANVSDHEDVFYVPPEFRKGNLLGINTWPGQRTWFGGPSDTEVYNYRIAPHGLAVFHRKIGPHETVVIPPVH